MSSSRASLYQKCPICDIRRSSHNSGNKECSICNDCYKSTLGRYCSICDFERNRRMDENRLEEGINESLADERKIQAACRQSLDDDMVLKNAIRQSVLDEAARKDAVKAKKAQETADHALAHQMAMLDLQIADQSSSSSSYSVSSQASRPASSQASRPASSQVARPASSQVARPASSQAPPKSVKTVGMFDRATHRRVSGNGACFFTSVWYLLYGSSGMTSSGGVLQISAKQLMCLKQEVLDYLHGLRNTNSQFSLDELDRFLQSVGPKKTIEDYARDLWSPGYYGGSVELSILVQKCRRSDQIAVALVNMDQNAPDLSPVFHSPNRSGPNYKLGVLLFSGAHYELMLNPNSPTGTFDVTHSYVMNELKNSVPELRRIASRLKRGGK
jgi:hypothetical protein